jgi:phosphoesterase RecJ-like protein
MPSLQKENSNPNALISDTLIFPKKLRKLKKVANFYIHQIKDPRFQQGMENLRLLLERVPYVYISTHESPDADGLGSEIGLALGLESLGIPLKIVNPGKVPKQFGFINQNGELNHAHLTQKWEHIDESVLLLLDSNTFKRTGRIYREIQQRLPRLFIIDHHTADNKLLNNHLIYTPGSSTGELIFQVLKYLGCTITEHIAKALYAAILFDTGSFRYPNTSPLTHRIIANLLQFNINPREIYEKIFKNYQPNRIALIGRIIQDIRFELDGMLAIQEIKFKDISRSGASEEDTFEIVNIPLEFSGVSGSVLFREKEDGTYKVSLRSTGKIDVAAISGKFNGGGHKNAAGATLQDENKIGELIGCFKKEILKRHPIRKRKAGKDSKK